MDLTIDQTTNVPAISRSVAEHALDAAVPVLTMLKLRSGLYKATVDVWDGVYRVSFVDKTGREGISLGNPGRVPGIQVKVDPKTFSVIRYGLIK